MTGDELPNSDHVVHYVKPGNVQKGIVNASEFMLRPGKDEDGISANWLEYFEGKTEEQQLDEVRRAIQLTTRPNGRFAQLNVGTTKDHVSAAGRYLNFVHDPQPAGVHYKADPSHSLIQGLPPNESPEATLVADLITECIQKLHPTFT